LIAPPDGYNRTMYTALSLVVLAGLLGPLLAAGRRVMVPVLVGELLGGIILGRTGLNVIDPGAQPFPVFASLGFAMLMLEAGTEVDIQSRLLREGAALGGLAFLLAFIASIPAAVAIAVPLRSTHVALFAVLLVGSSAAVAFPAIRERRLSGPSVTLIIAWITLADTVTALLMPLTLTGPSRIPAALLGDAVIVVVAAGAIALGRRVFRTGWADEANRLSKQRRWALRLRISVLLLLCLGAIAEHTGASLLVAGFAAGIVLRQFREPHRLALELTGLASGFFVPAFFVLLGANLDLKGLARSPSAITLAVAMGLAATAVHVVAAFMVDRHQRLASGLLASAQLGLPAAAAALGLSTGALRPPIATALVAGGLLTLIPATAGAMLLARAATGEPGRRE
jgi:Kef-type K+ transport system membrane component KefB